MENRLALDSSLAAASAQPYHVYEIARGIHYIRINYPHWYEEFIVFLVDVRGPPRNNFGERHNWWRGLHVVTYEINGVDSVADIQRLFALIYGLSGMAYRVSVWFHTIWEERVEEDSEVKYVYRATKTGRLRFVQPKRVTGEDRYIVIQKPWDLHYYKKQLTHERMMEFIQPENGSRSRLICVYKVGFKIVRLGTSLGGITELPDYLLNSRFIVNPAGIDDSDCFFAVIACAEGCERKRCSRRAKTFKAVWEAHIKLNPRRYNGLTYEDITEYLTNVNTKYSVTIYNITGITPSGVWNFELIYRSPFIDTRPIIRMNKYLNHLSLITKCFQKKKVHLQGVC